MLQDGRHESVVVAHDVEALDEGGTMVGCRRPFASIPLIQRRENCPSREEKSAFT